MKSRVGLAVALGLISFLPAHSAVCDGVSPVDASTLTAVTVATGLTGRPLLVTAPPGDPDRIFILDRVADPFRDLEAAVRDVKPDLVVIDTLAAFVASLDLDPGSATAWTPIMTRLARIARDHDGAIILLHHGRKSDGAYRDSS